MLHALCGNMNNLWHALRCFAATLLVAKFLTKSVVGSPTPCFMQAYQAKEHFIRSTEH